MIAPRDNPITLSKLTAEYYQDSDGNQEDNAGQTITFQTENNGCEFYFTIKTDRWAVDDAEEFARLCRDFEKRMNANPDNYDVLKREDKEE